MSLILIYIFQGGAVDIKYGNIKNGNIENGNIEFNIEFKIPYDIGEKFDVKFDVTVFDVPVFDGNSSSRSKYNLLQVRQQFYPSVEIFFAEFESHDGRLHFSEFFKFSQNLKFLLFEGL